MLPKHLVTPTSISRGMYFDIATKMVSDGRILFRNTRTRKISAPSVFMVPTASTSDDKSIRRTRSDFQLGYKTQSPASTTTDSSTTLGRRRERSASVRLHASSVTPVLRRSSSVDLSNRTGYRSRAREVAKSPLLETIAGSPPVSPPRNGEDASMPSFGETLGRVLDFSAPPPSSIISMKTSGSGGDFARVDDDDAMVDFRDDNKEVLSQMDRPRRSHSRSSSVSRRSSSVAR